MSYQIGMDALRLRPTPRLAHTEYCSNDALKRLVTGLGSGDPHCDVEFSRLWDLDLIWATPEGPQPWEMCGRITDMGHSEFLENGTDWRPSLPSPFHNVREVLSFDAVAEYGLTPMETLVPFYEAVYRSARARYADQVYTGGYYRTLVSGAIAIFGWNLLLEAAAERSRFARVLETIYEQAMHHALAWARTSIDVFMCHDDMVWSQGAFLHPDFYRSEIFPRYRELWRVLHAAGKLVVFCSDGDWGQFASDIVEAGADALCFEPMMAIEPIVERYGRSHAILSSTVDARTLTFGAPGHIKAEIDASLALARRCAGFIFAVGNHIPSNVPIANALYYIDYLRAHWGR